MSTVNYAALPSQPAAKLTTALLSGAAITLLLFAAMQQLIKTNNIQRPETVSHSPVQLYDRPKETEPAKRQPPPKMPEPEVREVPRLPPPAQQLTNISPGPTRIDPVIIPAKGGPDPNWGQGERGATPLVRVEPRYPIEAARDGITGWVQLSFSIDTSGAVTDISVLSAEPANLFNREAIRALKRWKYQPKIVDGVAVRQQNMKVQLDFSLQAD